MLQTVAVPRGSQNARHRSGDPARPAARRVAELQCRQEELEREKQELITGLLYINQERPTLPDLLGLTPTPLAQLPQERMRPSREAFAKLMEELM